MVVGWNDGSFAPSRLRAIVFFLALKAVRHERNRHQTFDGDCGTTLHAGAVLAGVEACDRFVEISKFFFLARDETRVSFDLRARICRIDVVDRFRFRLLLLIASEGFYSLISFALELEQHVPKHLVAIRVMDLRFSSHLNTPRASLVSPKKVSCAALLVPRRKAALVCYVFYLYSRCASTRHILLKRNGLR